MHMWDSCEDIRPEIWQSILFYDHILQLQWTTMAKFGVWFSVIHRWMNSQFLRISGIYG